MFIKIILVIVSSMFLLSDAFAQERENTLIYVEPSPPLTLNPLNIRDDVAFRLSSLLFNRLVIREAINMRPLPDLLLTGSPIECTSPSATFTFKLRQNAKCHHNLPFTARDIKFTFDMIGHEQTATNLRQIRNIINQVVIVNDTVQFRLNRKMELLPLLDEIAHINIISCHNFAANPIFIPDTSRFGRDWVDGTGPYKLISRDISGTIMLGWNNWYHNRWGRLSERQHRIENITMEVNPISLTVVNELLGNRIDLIPDVSPVYWNKIRGSMQHTLQPYNSRNFYFVALNCNPTVDHRRNPLNDQRVRKALNLGIDRLSMLTTIYGREGDVGTRNLMTGPYLPEDGISSNWQPIPYDQDEARRLLDNAGYPNGFTLRLKSCTQNEQENQIVNWIKEDLKKIGVKVEWINPTKDTWWKEVIVDKNFDMALGKKTLSTHGDVVKEMFRTNAPENMCSYSNQNVENEINNKMDQTYYTNKIEESRNKIHGIVREDYPHIFLFKIPLAAGYTKKLPINDKISPSRFFEFVNTWYKEE